LVARRPAEPRPPATLHYGWRRADPGNALDWWLSRLELPQVRERLLDGPQSASVPDGGWMAEGHGAAPKAKARPRMTAR
jgi:hypothetical protein